MIYRLQGVRMQFGEGNQSLLALKNLTLDIAAGENVALLGPSGSGKTTLFRLLNASLYPSSGQVLYRDVDIAGMTGAEIRAMRQKIGSVYQQHHLVPALSALTNTLSGALGRWSFAGSLRNLLHPQKLELESAEACLEAVGLQDKRHVRCDQLSGGQQQRLSIARTLMQAPEVILADEPVASLDPVLAEEILDLLVHLAGTRTLVMSLHQVDWARRYARRIVGLRDGELAFDLAPRELNQPLLDHLYKNDRASGKPSGPDPAALEIRRGSACRIR